MPQLRLPTWPARWPWWSVIDGWWSTQPRAGGPTHPCWGHTSHTHPLLLSPEIFVNILWPQTYLCCSPCQAGLYNWEFMLKTRVVNNLGICQLFFRRNINFFLVAKCRRRNGKAASARGRVRRRPPPSLARQANRWEPALNCCSHDVLSLAKQENALLEMDSF